MLRTRIITDINQRAMHHCRCRHSGGDTGRDVMTSDISVTVSTVAATQREMLWHQTHVSASLSAQWRRHSKRCYDIRRQCQRHCRHSDGDTGRDVMTSDSRVGVTVGSDSDTEMSWHQMSVSLADCRHSDVMTSDVSVNVGTVAATQGEMLGHQTSVSLSDCRHSGGDTGRDVMTSDSRVGVTVGTVAATQREMLYIRLTCRRHCRHSGGDTERDVMTSDSRVSWYDAWLMWKWRVWWWRSWLAVELRWQSTASGLQYTHIYISPRSRHRRSNVDCFSEPPQNLPLFLLISFPAVFGIYSGWNWSWKVHLYSPLNN